MSTIKTSASPSQMLTLTIEGMDPMVLAVDGDVDDLLATSMRAPNCFGAGASHRTNSTRKYQCNAALAYEDCIAKLVKRNELTKDGQAIRMIMEAGLRALGFAKVVDEVAVQRAADENAE